MDSREQLEASPRGKRWLGTFARSHLPFTIDHLSDPEARKKVPTLAEMTRAALRWLSDAPNFIFQVEGGRVDHACHNTDAAAALRDLIAFDEAVELCLEFQRQAPDTLLVVTTDHGNGNLALNGMGTEYAQSTWLFRNLDDMRCSFPEILRRLHKKPLTEPEKVEDQDAINKAREKAMSAAEREAEKARKKKEDEDVASAKEAAAIIHELTGYKVSTRKAEMLMPHLLKKAETLYDMMKDEVCALGQLMANHLGIAFTGNAHTADYVPLLALGPGAERFRGFVQNTQVFEHYLELANIKFQNPQEPVLTAHIPIGTAVADLPVSTGPEAQAVEDVESYRYV
jgi:alkaline phosphatase